jgi:hypothetical protein
MFLGLLLLRWIWRSASWRASLWLQTIDRGSDLSRTFPAGLSGPAFNINSRLVGWPSYKHRLARHLNMSVT